MRINSSGIGKTKMRIELSKAKKQAWKDRMIELDFVGGLASGVRECMRIALAYGWHDGEIVYKEYLKPPAY